MAFEEDPAELQRRLETRIAELSAAHKRIEEMREQLSGLKETRLKLKAARQERDALRASAEYWLGRKIIRPFRKLLRKPDPEKRVTIPPVAKKGHGADRPTYHQWRLTQLPTPARLGEMRTESRGYAGAPLFSIVMPTYNTPAPMLEQAVGSVVAQAYEKWELLIVDDASPEEHVRPLIEKLAAGEPRIKVRHETENSGIAMASNKAIAMATGDFVAFLDHDDWLEPDALYEMARRLIEHPETDFVYSDEDKVDDAGYFLQPFFKPDWSPDAFLSSNYCCHFTAIRRTLLAEIGGFRPGFDGAQDYELFLRATERARRIEHVPRVLYHWRISPQSTALNSNRKPAAVGNGAKALEEAVRRRGLDATVEQTEAGARYRVRHRIAQPGKISILIPTRDGAELLSRCLETLEAHTDWPNYEVVILDNGSTDPAATRLLRQTKHRVEKYEGPFNFAAICNYGVRKSEGEMVLFLNNDTEFDDGAWLGAMAEQAQRPEVGAVGALLLFPTGLVQHAGVVLAEADVATHTYLNYPADSMENGGMLRMVRNYSAVTAACMLTRRAVFAEAGGLDEKNFAVSYNDVDYCLRLRELGYSIVYTPYARVIHHESASRGYDRGNPNESRTMRERWAALLAHDPFNNPNLERREGSFGPLSR
jgi:GT2 family glycosyltransferase